MEFASLTTGDEVILGYTCRQVNNYRTYSSWYSLLMVLTTHGTWYESWIICISSRLLVHVQRAQCNCALHCTLYSLPTLLNFEFGGRCIPDLGGAVTLGAIRDDQRTSMHTANSDISHIPSLQSMHSVVSAEHTPSPRDVDSQTPLTAQPSLRRIHQSLFLDQLPAGCI